MEPVSEHISDTDRGMVIPPRGMAMGMTDLDWFHFKARWWIREPFRRLQDDDIAQHQHPVPRLVPPRCGVHDRRGGIEQPCQVLGKRANDRLSGVQAW